MSASLYILIRILSVNSSHVSDEVENLVGVTDLIVVPANNLNEGVSQSDTSLSIEDRSASVTQEVSRNNCILSVTKYTLQLVLRSLLDRKSVV